MRTKMRTKMTLVQSQMTKMTSVLKMMKIMI